MRTHHRHAFTLIEVLLVLLIIGMLAGVLITTLGGTQQKAQVDTTKLRVQKVDSLVQRYNLDIGHNPTESEGGLEALIKRPNFEDEKTTEKWAGPYAKPAELTDAWGKKLNYEPASPGEEVAPGVSFKLWSNGPDGQSNTADDISNFEVEK